MSYHSFRPGKEWLDSNGEVIQAHGFSVCYDENQRCYYWYGENKEKTKKGGTVWHWGVNLYRSEDLYNWDKVGLIIPPEPDDLQSPLHPTYCMDRPHILFCEKTGKYVAWLKIMGGEISQFMCVMESDHLEGPYTYVNRIYKPLQMDTGDFTLHRDSVTGKAYIIFDRPHFEVICADLTDDYRAVTGEYSAHYRNMRPPFAREAPTIFEKDGRKYLFTSAVTGYYPNKSDVCVFDDYHGEWKSLGDPCIGDKTDTTFNSQITCVLKIHGTEQYIACADRWMPQWYIPKMSKSILNGTAKHFENYEPDTSPKAALPLPGVEQKHSENTYKSRYVWLPIAWEGEKPVLRWKKEWTI